MSAQQLDGRGLPLLAGAPSSEPMVLTMRSDGQLQIVPAMAPLTPADGIVSGTSSALQLQNQQCGLVQLLQNQQGGLVDLALQPQQLLQQQQQHAGAVP